MKKIVFMLDDETKADVAEVKRTLFYDKSWADTYRHLVRLGLQESKRRADAVTKEE